jgi:hypothetical protein
MAESSPSALLELISASANVGTAPRIGHSPIACYGPLWVDKRPSGSCPTRDPDRRRDRDNLGAATASRVLPAGTGKRVAVVAPVRQRVRRLAA